MHAVKAFAICMFLCKFIEILFFLYFIMFIIILKGVRSENVLSGGTKGKSYDKN